jgi:hypothetical protein
MRKQTSSKNGRNRRQTFAISAPSASSVQLAGDFTQWNQKPVNLRRI